MTTQVTPSVFQSCIAFSAPMVRNVNMQAQFSGNQQAMGRISAAYQRSLVFTPGETIVICFLEGTQAQKQFVRRIVEKNYFNEKKEESTCNLNLKLDWRNDRGNGQSTNADRNASDCRIGFNASEGAYSYLGLESRRFPKQEKTMNLGWLDENNNGAVIIHEFGHFLGALIHEQQSPAAGNEIKWNENAVRTLFSNAPNFWTEDQIQINVLDTVDKESVNSSAYDPLSIMHYIFECQCFENCQPPEGLRCSCNAASPCACIQSQAIAINKLSETDIDMLERVYPFQSTGEDKDRDGGNGGGVVTINTNTENGGNDSPENGDRSCKRAKRTSIAFIVLFCLVAIALIVLGILIAKKRI